MPSRDASSVDLEDRIASRHVFETRIRIHLKRGTAASTVQGWTRDLSESGLSAFVADHLVVDELVTLEVPLPGREKQVIPSKVARSRGTEYGFQFTALSFEQRSLIQEILRGQPAIPFHRARP